MTHCGTGGILRSAIAKVLNIKKFESKKTNRTIVEHAEIHGVC